MVIVDLSEIRAGAKKPRNQETNQQRTVRSLDSWQHLKCIRAGANLSTSQPPARDHEVDKLPVVY
jgi:hypothetical protein